MAKNDFSYRSLPGDKSERGFISPALISLIHHIKLNESGWWNKALSRLIVVVIWLSTTKKLTIEKIKEELLEEFGIEISLIRLENQIQDLIENNILIYPNLGELKITESGLKAFETELKENENIEKYARNKFRELLRAHCPELALEEIWQSFNKELLAPMIREMGAKTYELVTGIKNKLNSAIHFDVFLNKFSPELHKRLQNVISNFIDPKDPNVRIFILRQLNAYFFLEAGNLSEETLQELSNISNKKNTFNIFLDTNFLFSILGLVEPYYDSAISFLNVTNRIKDKVNVKQYVTTLTIEEAKRVLTFQKKKLEEINLPAHLADAAYEREELNSFVKKFFSESKKSQYPLSANDYFSPFINNLTLALKSKGITIYNKNLEGYKERVDVLNDISDQGEFEIKRFGKKAKKYDQLMHDIALWHFVNELRPDKIESPKEASFWIATVDNRFLRFDFYKRTSSENIPICIYPTTLIQMLQFWVPRTTEIEEAIMHSLRLPFIFWQPFDAEAEKVTLNILKALSRYENITDFEKETVASILVNDVLRQKICKEDDKEKQHELIKEALIFENKSIRSKLDKERKKVTHLESTIGEKKQDFNKTLSKKNKEIISLHKKLESQAKQISRKKKKESKRDTEFFKEKKSLEKRIDKLEKKLQDSETAKKIESEKNLFIIKKIFIPLVLIILFEWGIYIISGIIPYSNKVLNTISIGCFLLLAWIHRIDREAGKNIEIKNWSFFRKLHKVKRSLFFALGSIGIAIIARLIFERIKEFF